MNSKQRRSVWREHKAKIEALEFQYRVLSGRKPDRSVTTFVPKHLELLQRAVAARRTLKAATGSSKGWCSDDPFQSFLWTDPISKPLTTGRGVSMLTGLQPHSIVIDEVTKLCALQHQQSLDWFKVRDAQSVDRSRPVGAITGTADTSSASVQRALARHANDQVDAALHHWRDLLARGSHNL